MKFRFCQILLKIKFVVWFLSNILKSCSSGVQRFFVINRNWVIFVADQIQQHQFIFAKSLVFSRTKITFIDEYLLFYAVGYLGNQKMGHNSQFDDDFNPAFIERSKKVWWIWFFLGPL